MRLKNKGQFPCDLVAFKVTNPARGAIYRQDWGQIIKFYIIDAISKLKGGNQIKRSDCTIWGTVLISGYRDNSCLVGDL